jgi:ribosomal-protein-alanine N-acetyltransferase
MISPVDDIDGIMAVMHAAFDPAYGEAWTRRQVEDALVVGNSHYTLAKVAGEPAGFTLVRRGFEEDELLLIGVAPQFRGRGLGKQLLQECLTTARQRGAHQVLLEMRRGNPAGALYRAAGFVQVGERLNYYRTPGGERLDAITFSCPL